MYDVLLTLGGIAMIAFMIGMIKPSLVIYWGETKNRWRVALVYGIAIVAFSMAAQAVISPEVKAKQEQEKAIAAQQKQEKEQAEAQAKLQKKQEEKLKEDQKQQEKAAKESQKAEMDRQAALNQVQDYKQKAQQIPYEALQRTPEKYKKAIVAYRGLVTNIIDESGNRQYLSVDTSGNGALMAVEFSRDKQGQRILPNDVIVFYGEFTGVEEYTDNQRMSIFVPRVKAQYVEINR